MLRCKTARFLKRQASFRLEKRRRGKPEKEAWKKPHNVMGIRYCVPLKSLYPLLRTIEIPISVTAYH